MGFFISKKLQEMQVLLTLAPQSESQGIKKSVGQREQAQSEGGVSKKTLCKKRENIGN